MARKPKASTVSGYHSQCNCFLLKHRPSPTGKYQLKLRLSIDNQPIKGATVQKLDVPVLYDDDTIKFFPAEFDLAANRAVAGFENGNLRKFNQYLHNLMLKAVEIGDDIYKRKASLTHTLLRDLLYAKPVLASSNREQVTLNPDEHKFLSEPITVDKTVLDTFIPEQIIDADTNQPVQADELEDALRFEQSEYDQLLRNEAINQLSTEVRYKKGLFDKDNIFQIFGASYFDPEICNRTYLKIIIRMFEYREHAKPEENVNALNSDWAISFFKWLDKTGYYNINTVSFDPLKYDRDIFFLNKKREYYQGKSLSKMISMFKNVVKGLTKKKLLPKIDLSEFKLSEASSKRDKKGTRIEHNINKDEFDTFYHFKFSQKKLSDYQQIFNKVNNSTGIIISIDDLVKARDKFILQTMFGGLRGYKELDTCELKKDTTGLVVSFWQNKVENVNKNPLNVYTEAVLKRYDYQMPVLVRNNSRENGKRSDSINVLEQFYRSLLRTIAIVINFDRDVLERKGVNKHVKIYEIFAPYFARKTFSQICSDELGMREEDIALFTGHVSKQNTTEVSESYFNKNTIKKKLEFTRNLKIGKGR